MVTEAQKRAQKKYDDANKDKFKCIQLKLNRETDADILEKLASVSSMQGYIKHLIRGDREVQYYKRIIADISRNLLHDAEEHYDKYQGNIILPYYDFNPADYIRVDLKEGKE